MPAFTPGAAYCEACGREVSALRPRPRHLLHAFLSVMSGGAWIPVWLIFALQRRPWRCEACGSEVAARALPRLRGEWIVRHFRRLRERGPWPFFWRVNVESFLVAAVAGGIVAGVADLPEEARYRDWGRTKLFVSAVLLAPVLETLLFQTVPVHLVRLCRGGFALQVAISSVLFAAPHFLEGPTVGVAAGVVGGFYLAFTYAHWAERATWTALWMTAASHALHNYVVVLIEACARRS